MKNIKIHYLDNRIVSVLIPDVQTEVKVDNRIDFITTGGKRVIVPLFNVAYIEEVEEC